VSNLFIRDWRVRAQLKGAPPMIANGAQMGADIRAPVRVQFTVTKTLHIAPNTMDLKVTNLSPANRRQMRDASSLVIFEAGYTPPTGQSTKAILFQGIARTVDHAREGPDWVTHIQCADGELGYRFAWANYSFGPGTAYWQVATTIVKQLQAYDNSVSIQGFLDQLNMASTPLFASGGRVFQHGDVYQGNALIRLQQIFPDFDISIQTGELRALKRPSPTSQAGLSKVSTVLLSPGSGLIGSPEHGSPDKSGRDSIIRVRALLQPKLQPGDPVTIQSAQFDGSYRVEKVTHSGDSAGLPWYSDLDLRVIQWSQ